MDATGSLAPGDALCPGERLPSDRKPVAVYLARLGPGSRRTMGQALRAMAKMLTAGRCDAESLAWHLLRYRHTAAIRTAVADRYKPSTGNKMLSALRGVLHECRRLGLLAADDYEAAIDVGPIKGSSLPRGRALAGPELQGLFAACAKDRTPLGARDSAVLAILFGAGLRRSEAVALDVSDYDPESGELRVRSGKGRKGRVTYLDGGGAEAVAAWLTVRGEAEGPFLLPVNKAGRVSHRRLSDQAVLLILRRRAAQAGVASFSPHDLRRTFVSDLLDAGVDLATVQKLAGHSNVQTTARYDRRGEAAKRRAVGLLDLRGLGSAGH